MIEISRALHLVLCGVYLILILNFLVLARPRVRGPNLNYLLMCVLNFFYSIVAFVGARGPHPIEKSIALILTAAALGFASMALFTTIMQSMIEGSKILRWLRYGIIGGAVVFGFSLIEVWGTGQSWTIIQSPMGYSNSFFAMMLPGVAISGPAKALLGLFSFFVLTTNLILLKRLWQQPVRDRWLIFGILFSLLVALNDNLLGLDLNSWMFPLACLGPMGEILRFQYLIVKKGQLASSSLKQALETISTLNATTQIRAILRHDLKHLTKDLKKFSSEHPVELQGIQGIAQLVEQLLHQGPHSSHENKVANVSECLQLAFHLLFEISASDEVRLVSSIQKDLEVNCRPGDLSLVFYNLLRNSIEAYKTQTRNQRPRLILVSDFDLGNAIEIQIQDQAGGVSAEVGQKIFLEPRSTKPGGQGLGLLSVRETLLANQALVAYTPVEDGSLFKLSFFKSE